MKKILTPEEYDRQLNHAMRLKDWTPENGFSEQEVLSAARHLGKLLDLLGISRQELEHKTPRGEAQLVEYLVAIPGVNFKRHAMTYTFRSLENYCDVRLLLRVVSQNKQQAVTLAIIGQKKDAEVAEYLVHLVYVYLQARLKNFKKSPEYLAHQTHQEKIHASQAFLKGTAYEISRKLTQLKLERTHPGGLDILHSDQVKALVLAKRQEISRFIDANIKPRPSSMRGLASYDAQAFASGKQAGREFVLTPAIKE